MTLVLTQKSHKCLMGFTLFSLCFSLTHSQYTMSESSKLTFSSSLKEIIKFHRGLLIKQSYHSTKTQQKDRACSICYLDLIIKGIGKQIIFKQKSLKQHYVKCHPEYESIKKSKNIAYFEIDDDENIQNGNIVNHNQLFELLNSEMDENNKKNDVFVLLL